MKNTQGALSFDAYIGDTDFNRTIQSMNQRIIGLSNTAKSESKKMESSFANMGQLAAGAFATIGLAQLPAQIVKVRGEFQQLEIAFGTMLQSKSKADKLMADVTKFAALTPYGLKDTAAATKQLLAYGESADTVIATMTKLGDIASGIGAPLGEIAYLYGTTMTQGRLYTQDLNQFTGRGIPMIRELAKIFGVAEKEVKGLVEAGKVGFPEVQKVIENLTKSGSMFGGLMEAQSKSLGGLQAQLGDAVDAMFNDIGRSQEGLISETLKGAIGVVENYEKVIDVLKVVVATYGTYRAALMLTAAVQSSALIISEAQAFFALARSIKTAADAQALFNIATRANPYVLAATAIMALVTAYAVFGDEASQAEKIQRSLADSMKAAEDAAAGEQAKIMVLTSQIKDETKSRESRNKKLQELIQLSPTHLNALTLENIATADGTKAIGDYIEAKKKQIELKEIEAQLEGSIKRQNEARNGQNDLSMWDKIALSASASSGVGDYSKNAASERKRLNGEIAQSEDQLQKKLIERIGIITGVGEAAKKTGAVVAKVSAKTVENYNEEIKALKDKQEKSASSAEYKALDNQIKSLEKARDRITGGKVAKVAEKDKPQPFGSLAYYEQVARKADEIIAKTPGGNVSEITRQNQIKIEAEKKADEIRKLTAVRTFEDELAQKKTSYENYQRWVTAYGESEAKKSFESLTNQGESYAAYLAGQIKKLEDQEKLPGVGLDGVERENLVKLKVEYSDVTGAETPLQKFQKRLDEARSSATSLTDEIEKLKAVQAGLNPNDMSSDGIEMRKQTAEQLIEANRERKAQLQEYLISVAGSEEKRLSIESKYHDLRLELEKKYGEDRGVAFKASSERLESDKKAELLEDQELLISKSKEYRALTRIIEDSTDDQTLVRLNAARGQLALTALTHDKESELYRKHLAILRAAEKEHSDRRTKIYASVGDALAALGLALSDIDGILGNTGKFLSSIGSGIGVLQKSLANFEKIKKEGGEVGADAYIQAGQAAIQIASMVIDSAKQRKLAEQQYFDSVISQQKQYNQLLVERIGLEYQAGESVFLSDPVGKITSGVNQLSAATEKYEESIAALADGQAKTGQKTKVDWGKVGSSTVTGAAAGAAIGGPWGAAIGGAVGFVSGLFGGKKKEDVYGGLLDVFPELVSEAGVFNKTLAQTLVTSTLIDDKTKVLIQDTISWADQIEASKEQIKSGISDLAGSLGNSIRGALVSAFKSGEDSAKAFGDVVGGVLEDIISQILFNQLFAKTFKKLEKEIAESLDTANGGDGSIVDDVLRATTEVSDGIPVFNEGMEAVREQMEKLGLNVFGKELGGEKAKGMTGAIQGMSQETASLLAGQFNALRISGADSANSLRQMLIYQANISRNSDYQKNLTLLVEINAGIKDLNKNPLRASGL